MKRTKSKYFYIQNVFEFQQSSNEGNTSNWELTRLVMWSDKNDTIDPQNDTIDPQNDTIDPQNDTIDPKNDTIDPVYDTIAPTFKKDTIGPENDIIGPCKCNSVSRKVSKNVVFSIFSFFCWSGNRPNIIGQAGPGRIARKSAGCRAGPEFRSAPNWKYNPPFPLIEFTC